ncbi:CRISPR-associated ring nuclease Crn3/Csx3 [Nostoc sp. 'Peltigera membranacea cyanobiont' N6]|uniref:CRISPR-associated ring nuclease Crn3/Csx3 n=1 Tax=Nostoc sp. 'Peltigera membranacea cyanobiont' N6 TaxID=1261031 RepID=UPI000CF33474|nr:CRISPR-associated ring nuclease Crn3/Csx3 [Nostoc sp. 'Peltigera membranacea cyanobiont' N6]AVH61974.1 CRISPR-associated protein Csx3 [Nostoc sp. 'Peltigera membranacea cyanobiont' N6]
MITPLRLYLSESLVVQNLKYQVLSVELTSSDRLIEPQNIKNLELPSGIDTTGGVVISGRAPMWLYSYLTHALHPTAWVACYDPRLGAVVSATNSRQVCIGQVIPVSPPNGRQNHGLAQEKRNVETGLCPALMVVGPPDSGKSVLSHALFQALLSDHPDIYLQRAHWDGEGNYVLELSSQTTDEEIEGFKVRNKGALTERFFPYHAQAILQLRRQKSLVIVDVGGMVQPEKLPILEACTHYLIISSKPEAVGAWHEFCRDRGNLIPVAVIHSSLAEVEEVHQVQPYLEITSGPWVRGRVQKVPEILLKQVKTIFTSNQ